MRRGCGILTLFPGSCARYTQHAIVVYVDDFLRVFRTDYGINEVDKAFSWGTFSHFELFNGKELTLRLSNRGRHVLSVLFYLPNRVHPRAARSQRVPTLSSQCLLNSKVSSGMWPAVCSGCADSPDRNCPLSSP